MLEQTDSKFVPVESKTARAMDDDVLPSTASDFVPGVIQEIDPVDNSPTDNPPQHKPKPRRFTYPSGTKALGFTIKRGIGIGGFGEVYFAISEAGKEVALKRIQRNLDVEIRGVSQCLNLKHTNLIALWDIRQDSEGESWVVMEYVPGESLRDVLERNPNGIPMVEAKKWFTEILAGVQYLHDHGIVHRDLKPGNIFFDQDEKIVKIGDYGLSKFISSSRRDGQTESVGTFHYMAPEIGKGSYGKEIDIYSLGIILCEILTGKVPFDGESGQEIIMKHLTADPEFEFIPPVFLPVLHRALAKDPAQRYADVRELKADLVWDDTNDGQSHLEKIALGNPPGNNLPVKNHRVEATLFIRDIPDPAASIRETRARAEEPLYIGDEEIQLGHLRDHSNHQRPITESIPQQPNPVSPTLEAPNDDPDISVISSRSLNTQELAAQEPIAQAVKKTYQPVVDWWNGAGGTPFKVLLVVILSIVVLVNAQWLIPMAIGVGCLYTVYYFIRMSAAPKRSNKKMDATVIRPFSQRDLQNLVTDKLREQRGDLPAAEKISEALGSLIFASLVIGVCSLVAIGGSGYDIDGSPASLSLFAWLSLSSLLATATAISFSKIFESNKGNSWVRRFVLMTTGLLIGIASFSSYQGFFIGDIEPTRELTQLQEALGGFHYDATLTSFLLYFAGLFALVRWWRVGDPLRSTQFSVFGLVLHLVLSSAIAIAVQFPLHWSLMICGFTSIAVQMSSNWVKRSEREKLRLELMHGSI